MSLSKQLLLFFSIFFLLLFSINFFISFNTLKNYLEHESKNHLQGTADTLGSSLKPYMANENQTEIETQMKTLFVTGLYQQIALLDAGNNTLSELTRENKYGGTPAWFIQLLPLTSVTALSEIRIGSILYGRIKISMSPDQTYQKLYQQLSYNFYCAFITFFLSIGLLIYLLRITVSSITVIEKIASNLSNGTFTTSEQVPWTTELRGLTLTLNKLSKKIEQVFIKLQDLGKKLEQDELTGLNKKSSFDLEIKKIYHSDLDHEIYIFIIKIDSLAKMVNILSSATIDQFLNEIAQVLNVLTKPSPQIKISVYRFLGSEFALLVRHASLDEIKAIANQLSQALHTTGKKYHQTDIAHIGITPLSPYGSVDGILSAVNEAYEQARLIGADSYFIRNVENRAKNITEWKSLIYNTIDNDHYNVSFTGETQSLIDRTTLIQDAFTQIYDQHGKTIEIGTFVSIAEKYEKIIDLDKGITTKVINAIKTESITHGIAINLSVRTIKSSTYRNWLTETLRQNQTIASQLIFTSSAYAITKETAIFKEFISFIHLLGSKFMIKRFDIHSISPESIASLKPDFIRLNQTLSNSVALDNKKRTMIETIVNIGSQHDIAILAENVSNENDINWLKSIGVIGASF